MIDEEHQHIIFSSFSLESSNPGQRSPLFPPVMISSFPLVSTCDLDWSLLMFLPLNAHGLHCMLVFLTLHKLWRHVLPSAICFSRNTLWRPVSYSSLISSILHLCPKPIPSIACSKTRDILSNVRFSLLEPEHETGSTQASKTFCLRSRGSLILWGCVLVFRKPALQSWPILLFWLSGWLCPAWSCSRNVDLTHHLKSMMIKWHVGVLLLIIFVLWRLIFRPILTVLSTRPAWILVRQQGAYRHDAMSESSAV